MSGLGQHQTSPETPATGTVCCSGQFEQALTGPLNFPKICRFITTVSARLASAGTETIPRRKTTNPVVLPDDMWEVVHGSVAPSFCIVCLFGEKRRPSDHSGALW